MIIDDQTNFLYLADFLKKKYPDFFNRFERVLDNYGIAHDLLPFTKDIWAVDFMPVQIKEGKFLNFTYYPDYLRYADKWKKTISDAGAICNALGIPIVNTNILADGGNVIKGKDCAIMCDKIFCENPHFTRNQLTEVLLKLLEVSKVIFIPTDPHDDFGHADGIVRFLNDKTVLINKYSPMDDEEFQLEVRNVLRNNGLELIEIPFNPFGNNTNMDATGIYINYLQMKEIIILPVFGMKEDKEAVRQFENIFREQTIATVECNEIAREGGLLNCITWNILLNRTLSKN